LSPQRLALADGCGAEVAALEGFAEALDDDDDPPALPSAQANREL
jgi:hypothetical protein